MTILNSIFRHAGKRERERERERESESVSERERETLEGALATLAWPKSSDTLASE
jgi:hypothetical protein